MACCAAAVCPAASQREAHAPSSTWSFWSQRHWRKWQKSSPPLSAAADAAPSLPAAITIVTANPGTLRPREMRNTSAPARKAKAPMGKGLTSRVVELDAQFAAMGADVVGMQEGRLPLDGSMESCHYSIFRVGATAEGLDGTLIWISKGLNAKVVCTIPVSPRILRVSAICGHVWHIFSAHAPTEDASVDDKDIFWAALDTALECACHLQPAHG